jgi:type I restriction enzyme R subunit
LIDPALAARGWTHELIRREVTQPRVALEVVADTTVARRRGRGRLDYLLRYKLNPGTQAVALALIEAKAEDKSPGHGLEQAKAYRDRHNVPFVFSSNGHLFVEYDDFTGLTSDPRPVLEFPTPEELRTRYEQGKGFRLDAPEARPLITPYKGGDEARRRYYQDAAIRAVLEKVAAGHKRALLTLATGTGKTFIATKLLHKIADAGQLTRALFICDRDELRTQGLAALRADFGADAQEVSRVSGRNNAANARIHVATYQTLGGDMPEGDLSFLSEFYPPGYFSHIVIDECHRSAWGSWFEVLKRNPGAVQIGLTATPRKLDVRESSAEVELDERIRAHNFEYFGEPVYSYDIAQGIEDGYLAACEIVRREVFIEDQAPELVTGLTQERLAEGRLKYRHDGSDAPAGAAKPHYEAGQFESAISIPERTLRMADDLFAHLLATGGPHQKTIIFCAREDHAAEVAASINNAYAKWCKDAGEKRLDPYAFRCTSQAGGQSLIPDFKGAARSHFIACTVDLLSTGVDVPSLRNVVFFRYIRSPISFYQMIGRGTRIDEASGKLMFRVYDYTDATRLLGEEFKSKVRTVTEPAGPPIDGPDKTDIPPFPVLVLHDLEVRIEDGGRFVLMQEDGRDVRIPVEEYRRRLAEELRKEAPDVETFRRIWIEPPQRRSLVEHLLAKGYAPRVIQHVDGLEAYDDFDVLGSAGYQLTPRTRDDRAARFPIDHSDWLGEMPADTRAAVVALTGAFARGGTEELESRQVLQTPAVRRAGGLAALSRLGEPQKVLKETRERLFAS